VSAAGHLGKPEQRSEYKAGQQEEVCETLFSAIVYEIAAHQGKTGGSMSGRKAVSFLTGCGRRIEQFSVGNTAAVAVVVPGTMSVDRLLEEADAAGAEADGKNKIQGSPSPGPESPDKERKKPYEQEPHGNAVAMDEPRDDVPLHFFYKTPVDLGKIPLNHFTKKLERVSVHFPFRIQNGRGQFGMIGS
jgi:hypothetical protein